MAQPCVVAYGEQHDVAHHKRGHEPKVTALRKVGGHGETAEVERIGHQPLQQHTHRLVAQEQEGEKHAEDERIVGNAQRHPSFTQERRPELGLRTPHAIEIGAHEQKRGHSSAEPCRSLRPEARSAIVQDEHLQCAEGAEKLQ